MGHQELRQSDADIASHSVTVEPLCPINLKAATSPGHSDFAYRPYEAAAASMRSAVRGAAGLKAGRC